MTSLILRTATRYIFPVLLIFSIHLLLRGHQLPGGGFVGGLFAGSAFTLYTLAFGAKMARKILRLDPADLTAAGLGLALLSALPALFYGKPFMTGIWWHIPLSNGERVALGTPLLFDIGVYFVVLGVLLTLVFSLAEEQ